MVEQLDDARIKSIIANRNLYSDFPALESIAKRMNSDVRKTSKPCNCNKSKKIKSINSNFAVLEFKNYIKQMSQADRNKFKSAINADSIVFMMTDASGVVRTLRY